MKKKVLPIFYIILFSFFACNKQSSNFKRVFRNDILKAEFQINEKDLMHGIYKAYYRNGNDSLLITYKNGEKDGVEIEFFKNGRMKSVMHYLNGKLEDKVVTFKSNGTLNQIASFRDDKFNGANYLFYQNGMLEKLYYAKDTVVEGPQYSYYSNGILGRYDYLREDSVVYTQQYTSGGYPYLKEGYTIAGINDFYTGAVGDSLEINFIKPPGCENNVFIIEYDELVFDTVFKASNIDNYSYRINDISKDVKIVARITDLHSGESFASEMVLKHKSK